MNKDKFTAGVAYAVALLCAGANARAETATEAATPVSDQLSEVIVTAERRSENLQNTPVAVTAYSAADIEQQGIRSLYDIMGSTPNIQLEHGAGADFNNTVISIRGFNVSRQGLGVQPPVGLYIDDYYYPSFSASALQVLDLTSLEVLRGPQGTLFGRNTLGGAVLYNTVMPSQEFGGHVEVTGGRFDRHDFSGAVNIPITDILAVRLTGAILRSDGYLHDQVSGASVGDTESRVGRAQIRFTPTSDLTVDLTAEYFDSKIYGSPQILVTNLPAGTSGTVPNFWNLVNPPSNQDDQRYQSTCKYCATPTTTQDYADSKTNDYRATITWNVNDSLTFKSLTGIFYIDTVDSLDTDYTPLPYETSATSESERAYSQELQLSGKALDSNLRWIGGIYLYKYVQDSSLTSTDSATAFPPSVQDNYFTDKSAAAYAQVSYTFIPQWTATLGLRETYEKVNALSIYNGVGTQPPDASFKKLSPEAKLQYQVTPDIMTYISAGQGYRAGTINTAVQPNVPVQYQTSKVNADSAWSYEIGARTELLDHHLIFNATLFDEEYKDLQLLVTYAPTAEVPFPGSVLENAGKARFYGAELESQAVFDQLRFRATLATLNTRYLDVGDASDITTNSKFERAPSYTYSLGAGYTQPLSQGSLQYNLDWNYITHQIQGNQDHVSAYLPAYGLLNGRVAYAANKHWNVSVGLDNILNKYYLLNAGNNLYYLGYQVETPGAPRSWFAKLQYNF